VTAARPTFSIVTPVYETPLDVLDEMVRSVTGQSYGSWQLILVDDRSPSEAVRDYLRAAATAEPRITVVLRETNGGISAASNDAIAAATGEYTVLLDHDDLLVEGALEKVAAALAAHPLVDYLYTDEDKVDGNGVLYEEFRKPDWSPERLRSQMYCGHLSVLRTRIVREVGGFDSGVDGSQDHDLVLKVTERARQVYHLPEVLYHWRALADSTASSGDAKPYAWDAGVRAVQAHVDRLGLDTEVRHGVWFGTYALHRRLDEDVLVSVILAADGSVDGIGRTVRSLAASTEHTRVEYIVVSAFDRGELDRELGQAADVTIVECGHAAGFSERCNQGFLASAGDVVVLVDDGLDVVAGDVITDLAACLAEPDVGLVGAQVFDHEGLVYGAGHNYADRQFGHALLRFAPGDPGPFSALMIDREVSGLDTECVALRRETYIAVGGLSESLPPKLSDVDLSFKTRMLGLRLVWVSRVHLAHRSPPERAPAARRAALDLVRARWASSSPDRPSFDV
jgi:GT2 family glycosyltransferase